MTEIQRRLAREHRAAEREAAREWQAHCRAIAAEQSADRDYMAWKALFWEAHRQSIGDTEHLD